ncbi:MAG TPA: hypothetical protein VNJ02_07970 [Vicinamibacterales bacterium]|nr:hypothetical protein [Vicinamibacterales bacterium]
MSLRTNTVFILAAVVWIGSAQATAQTVLPAPALQGGLDLGPKTVVPAFIACADVPTTVVPVPALRIVAPHAVDLHEHSSRNDLVVISGGTPQGLAIGQRYFTRRVGAPISREAISVRERGSIRTSGWLTIVAADERSALARIDYACTAVESGDYLDPYVEPTLPATIAPDGPTDFNDLGRVLFGLDQREEFGAGDFLTIDRGASRGVVSGTRVGFYRDRENGTPLVEIGNGIVVEVNTETAKVVVQRANQDIRRDDYWGIRARP